MMSIALSSDDLLKKQQKKMLDILLYIDTVCKEYNIKYWLSSGTLLGAVRHKGFIPWDDDLDIEMLREDYDKLINLLQSSPGGYILQTYATDKNYYQSYAKVRDKSSIVYENSGEDFYYTYRGVFIDIFPLEKNFYSIFRFTGTLHNRLITQISRVQNRCKIRKLWLESISYCLFGFLYPFLRWFGNIFYDGKYLNHSLGVPYFKRRCKIDIFPLKTICFEGHDFPCPNNVDHYLQKIYGDYMKLPPINLRQIHVNKIDFL